MLECKGLNQSTTNHTKTVQNKTKFLTVLKAQQDPHCP